ncbi:COG4315 family predicted lipoprotein [Streptomyces aidingensis]|uniref:Predicted lipoprotein with conserved Yx(FWY)xxD motif n=1 Tax=Streptomyces aidingensis TaxID=910347 RepID=A0A1I1JZP0_9ACTN|nr:hypothetical protein [Streptomyces aidingensis]SFC53845.1 Predicted lipoprotein with conserved Yx(FWY)xxD motif [Streptomyces aidingensis]
MNNNKLRAFAVAAAGAAVLFTTTACEDTGTDLGGGGADSGAEEDGGAAEYTGGVAVHEHPEYGQILVDGEGRTLYRFTDDSDSPVTSACTEDCLDLWPAAEAADPAKVTGVDTGLLDAYQRPDTGTYQLVIDNWPLYTYQGDTSPGDAVGQGVGDKWYVVAPDGSLIRG